MAMVIQDRLSVRVIVVKPPSRLGFKQEVRSKEGHGRWLIAEGQRRGEIDPRLKPAKVAPQFLQTCIGSVLLWSLHEKPALGAWIDDSFQYFWRSIAITCKKKAS